MNNNHCRFLFILFKAGIIEIASSSASCKKGGIYSYKVEVTFAIDKKPCCIATDCIVHQLFISFSPLNYSPAEQKWEPGALYTETTWRYDRDGRFIF